MCIALLISGNLGFICFKHLLDNGYSIHSVLTDRKSESIITLAKRQTIPLFIGNPRQGKTLSFFDSLTKPDILFSINYLFIIEEDLIKCPKLYAINFHGALLPHYRGRTPHVWAIINNEKETGITAHLINKECDKGKIIEQVHIPITQNDTGGALLKKFLKQYPVLVDIVLNKIKTNSLSFTDQDEDISSFFPKRTPEDGEINWNWQKERIYNWVRAMAPPEYPGAFYKINNEKIIIKKIEFSDRAYSYDIPNGKIIEYHGSFMYVKSPNGIIKAYVENKEKYKCILDAQQNRTEQNRTEQNRTEQNRTEQNRTEQIVNWFMLCQVIKRYAKLLFLQHRFFLQIINNGLVKL